MLRRSVLFSLVSVPALSTGQTTPTNHAPAGEKAENSVPLGPDVTVPEATETPTIPVVPASDTSDPEIRTFSKDQFAALMKLGEILIPAWKGKPGATEAGAAQFLDFLIGCSPEARVDLYKRGLDELNDQSQTRFGKRFASASASEANALLVPLREHWSYGEATRNDFRAFLIAAKHDFLRATQNSHPYIDAIAEERRPRNASRFYWLPID